ncbi:T6SS phospholipase effector Tle1-like catalytic domain-containing protein [Vibrio injensis]|uniref:phospholipase effector Tle1 domain-containing protein n=1 Tax=Vibrio injensis TaxID=1307414 RepID=UPI000A7DDF23|nr:DUF2235 domain-containing protein [Vibrio injensis]
MSSIGANPHCISCERYENWIELDLRDEHNRSFAGQTALVTDATGKEVSVVLSDQPSLITDLAVGPVTVKLATQAWLKEAQSRAALAADQVSPLAEYVIQVGYNQVVREHIKVTSGELCLTEPDSPLPERHQAGQAELRLFTNHSYVLEVQGYQISTLRIGVFFDGTANNSFNHLQGKNYIEAFLEQCDDPEQREALRRQCEAGEIPVEDNSQGNDITNIGKAHSLYSPATEGALTVAVYIDGIGTTREGSDAMLGQGFDLGDTSSLGQVQRACRTLIVREIKRQLARLLAEVELIHRIEFDVFGFSRGASAARQFVNLIDANAEHALAEALANEPSIRLTSGFNWASRDEVRVEFVGLFDTVVTSQFNRRQVTLQAEQAARVVQLVANDEWRVNFALTKISDQQTIAPNFTEVIVPGSHSDVGGGYYSRWSLSQPHQATPLLTEKKRLKRFTSIEYDTSQPERSQAYRRALAYAEQKLAQGWASGITVQHTRRAEPVAGQLTLAVRTDTHTSREKDSQRITVSVWLHRIVEGEYSRIPLHILVEAARDVGVPFREWDTSDDALKLNSVANPRPNFNLQQLDVLWSASAKQAGQIIDLTRQLSNNEYRALRRDYLHHSADAGIVNAPNQRQGQEVRRQIDNQQGGK